MHGLVTLHLAEKLRLGAGIEDLIEPLLDSFFHGHPARPLSLVGGRRP